MARPTLDFGPPEHANPEGVRFRLHGEGWEEWFTTTPEVPSGVLTDLLVAIQYDDQRRRVYSAPHLIRFMFGVLREEVAVWVGRGPDDEAPEGAEVVTPEQARARGLEVVGERGPEQVLAVQPADDMDRFAALVKSKRRLLPVEQLGACVVGLAEALTNRPTQPPGS